MALTEEELVEMKVIQAMQGLQIASALEKSTGNEITLKAFHKRLDSLDKHIDDKPTLSEMQAMLESSNNALVANVVKKIGWSILTVLTAGLATWILDAWNHVGDK